MPKPASPLLELNRLAASARGAIAIDVEFARPDGLRQFATGEDVLDDAGKRSCVFDVAIRGGRGAAEVNARIKHRAISAVIRAMAKKFPNVDWPPAVVQVRGRGLPVTAAEFKEALLAGLAEAYGREAPAEPEVDARPVASEWFEALKSGRAGVRRWNALKADERRAVDLSGIGLKDADLSGFKLRGVRAKGAILRGAKLTRAELGESVIEGADLSGSDLSRAEFRGARASEANFKKAKLVGADLRDGLFAGASFAGADLTDADLRDATLIRADFTGATFDGVNVDGATFDGRTAWPAGFTIPAEVYFVGKDTDPRLVGKGKSAVAVDIHGLIARLRGLIDPKRMKRTADMLKSGKNQLFAQIDTDNVRGIVRSQREVDLIYSCVLTDDGGYACCTPDLEPCMGLRGEPCKHLLVLLIGLARAGQLDVAAVDRWLMAAKGKPHRWNNSTKDHVSDSLLRYKGVQAGEVDWRPTETIPEDFYAM
jgi:uncharacterized protein YjbI with pentapeptide repeats